MQDLRKSKKTKNKKGFTLVEVIIVLVILVILAAILVPSYAAYVDKTKVTRCKVQRAELSQKFLAMYHYDDEIRECTSEDEVIAITGQDVAQYMLDNKYYEGSIICPVHGQPYGFRFTYKNNSPKGEFLCGCVPETDDFSVFEAISKRIAAAYTGWDRSDVIRSVHEEYGGLPEVNGDVLSGTGFTGATMYWRPYYLGNRTSVVFYGVDISYEDNPQGLWRGKVLSIDGRIYVNTSGNYSIAGFYNYNNFSELLNSSSFRNNFTEKQD